MQDTSLTMASKPLSRGFCDWIYRQTIACLIKDSFSHLNHFETLEDISATPSVDRDWILSMNNPATHKLTCEKISQIGKLLRANVWQLQTKLVQSINCVSSLKITSGLLAIGGSKMSPHHYHPHLILLPPLGINWETLRIENINPKALHQRELIL